MCCPFIYGDKKVHGKSKLVKKKVYEDITKEELIIVLNIISNHTNNDLVLDTFKPILSKFNNYRIRSEHPIYFLNLLKLISDNNYMVSNSKDMSPR